MRLTDNAHFVTTCWDKRLSKSRAVVSMANVTHAVVSMDHLYTMANVTHAVCVDA